MRHTYLHISSGFHCPSPPPSDGFHNLVPPPSVAEFLQSPHRLIFFWARRWARHSAPIFLCKYSLDSKIFFLNCSNDSKHVRLLIGKVKAVYVHFFKMRNLHCLSHLLQHRQGLPHHVVTTVRSTFGTPCSAKFSILDS